MKSILFAAETEADDKAVEAGEAKPSEILMRRTRALMAKNGAKPDEFERYMVQVTADDPDMHVAYIHENGTI